MRSLPKAPQMEESLKYYLIKIILKKRIPIKSKNNYNYKQIEPSSFLKSQ
jgi:hypothetical protein